MSCVFTKSGPEKTAEVIDRLCRTDLPALKRAGATTLGVFDVQSGPSIPGLAHVLTWPSYEARAVWPLTKPIPRSPG